MHTVTTFRESFVAFVLAVTVAGFLYGPPAMSAPAPSLDVRVDDVDLASEQGPTRLLERLKSAARDVCSRGSPHDRWTLQARERCYAATLEHALRQLGEPRVRSAYRAQWRASARSTGNHGSLTARASSAR